MSSSISRRQFFIQGGKVLAASTAASGLAGSLLAACGSSSSGASTGPVSLTYTYLNLSGVPLNQSAVQDAFSALTKSRINASVTLNDIDSSTYNQKTLLGFTGGTIGDLVFTASWINSFVNNVGQGNLLPLDDLLTKYAPKTKQTISQQVFSAARVHGKLYGVPNVQLFPTLWGVQIRKDLADKYSVDASSFHAYADLEPLLAQLKQQESGLTPIYSNDRGSSIIYHGELFGFDELLLRIAVKIDDPNLQAFVVTETDQFRQSVELARKWYQAGYFTQTPLPTADANAAFKAGKYAMILSQSRPESPAKFKASYGYDEVQALFVPKPYLATGSIQATLTAIPRSSKNPERAMELLELLNNDKEVYNLLCHGIEGQDYTVVDKASNLITVPSTSRYNPNSDWVFGNQFNAFYTDPAQVTANLWPASAQLNQQTTPSVALGFTFDPTPVKSQVAQVTAAQTQYFLPLVQGLVDPTSGIAQLRSAQEQAGIKDVVSEVQRQLDAWKQSK